MNTSKYTRLLLSYLQYYPQYLKTKRLLKPDRFNTKEEVEQYQLARLREITKYAYRYVPYYRRTFDRVGFHPGSFNSIEELKNIPFLTKQLIRENWESLISTAFPAKHRKVVQTGGTTGMPLEFILDNRYATLAEMVYLRHMWKKVGYRQHDRCIVLREDNVDGIIEGKRYWKRNLLTNWLIMSAFHLNGDTFDLFYRKIRSFKPKFMLAFPSNAYLLAHYIRENGLDPIPSLKAVICASENLYDWQRREMSEIFNAQIFSYYGHSEKCILAAESADSGSFEFYPQYGYVELVNSSGEDCREENETGEIVATGFNNYAFPLIRYKTDDLATSARNGGLGHPHWFHVKKIEGRTQDFLIDSDHIPKTYMHIDRPFWDLRHVVYAYQYEQFEPGKVLLKIHAREKLDEEQVKRIKDSFLKAYIKFSIEVKQVDHIPRSSSGKFRYLIQHIQPRHGPPDPSA